MQNLNTRIASRTDTKGNWETENPILLCGEVAIVFDGDNQLFKVGDGVRHFNDLPYSFYDQFVSEQINTTNLRAKNINQGYNSGISGIGGIATGYKSQVSSNFAQAHGYIAQVSSDFGYVWNGDNTVSDYVDHGNGTYNINTKNGIYDFYIGNRSLKEIIHDADNLPVASVSSLGCVQIGSNLCSDTTTGVVSLNPSPVVSSIGLPSLSSVTKFDDPTTSLIQFCETEPETFAEGVLYLIKE